MKIAIAIARNTKYLLFKNEDDFFLNEELRIEEIKKKHQI